MYVVVVVVVFCFTYFVRFLAAACLINTFKEALSGTVFIAVFFFFGFFFGELADKLYNELENFVVFIFVVLLCLLFN